MLTLAALVVKFMLMTVQEALGCVVAGLCAKISHCLGTDVERAALLASWPSETDVDVVESDVVLVDF